MEDGVIMENGETALWNVVGEFRIGGGPAVTLNQLTAVLIAWEMLWIRGLATTTHAQVTAPSSVQ